MTYTYTAKSGVLVTSCKPGDGSDDFPTMAHYMVWSYKAWGTKIVKTVIGMLQGVPEAK